MLEGDLIELFQKGCYLDLIGDSDDGSDKSSGFIVGLNTHFVVLQSIEDWHSDGIEIFPLNRVDRYLCDDLKKKQQKILAWHGVKRTNQYDWVDLSGYKELFLSIRGNAKSVFIADDEDAEVGEISEVRDHSVLLRGIDATGSWIEDRIEFSFEDILHTSVDDEYSRVLKKFADATS